MKKTLIRPESGTENRAGKRPSFRGGRFGERRVCALGHVKMNEWKAYLNRSLALQWPVWIESWTERPRPTNRLAEMSSLESEQAWTLRTSWRFWGRGGMASAEPKRKRSPKNAHQEAAARPKKRRLGSRLYGQTRAHFRGRIPAPILGPDSGPT